MRGHAKWRKAICLICGIIVIVGIVVFNVPWRLSTTVAAVEIDIYDLAYCSEQQITMEGTYSLNLFSEDEFFGKIILHGYDDTEKSSMMRKIDVTSNNGGSILSYYSETEEKWTVFGGLYSNRLLRNIVIAIYEPGKEQGTRYIVGGASTRDEALDLIDQMSVVRE